LQEKLPKKQSSGQFSSSKQEAHPPESRPKRKQRRDAGKVKFNERDAIALIWIGQQYGIHLDHLQLLLGKFPGKGAKHKDWISESSVRSVVKRWEEGKWARRESMHNKESFWLWPTRLGLLQVGLPYTYHNVGKVTPSDRVHLYAINDIRLYWADAEQEATQWISERQLLHGLHRSKGQALLHRPDGEIHYADGTIIAVEAELSEKKSYELEENLMELLRGEAYLRLKAANGIPVARVMSAGCQSRYTEIWYFAPSTIRKQLRHVRARLLQRGDLNVQEARRLFVRWYPLAKTAEEMAQEEQEEEEAFK
jgi:hypothetical protein